MLFSFPLAFLVIRSIKETNYEGEETIYVNDLKKDEEKNAGSTSEGGSGEISGDINPDTWRRDFSFWFASTTYYGSIPCWTVSISIGQSNYDLTIKIPLLFFLERKHFHVHILFTRRIYRLRLGTRWYDLLEYRGKDLSDHWKVIKDIQRNDMSWVTSTI